jgi:competence protein ComEA
MFGKFLRLVAVVLVVSVAPAAEGVVIGAQTAKPRTPTAAQAITPASPAIKPAAIVNLNTATLLELEALPGVGAKTAARIVDYRQKKGPFKKIEELMNVQGIGEKSFLKLKPQITVAANAPATHGQ